MAGDDIKQRVEEWFRQADYDYETAVALFDAGRYIYAVFLCHLALEKAVKGLYKKRFGGDPPKVHNLNYFIVELGLYPNDVDRAFIDNINDLSVPTRYPEDLGALLKNYKKTGTGKIVRDTKRVLEWLKTKSKVL